MQAYIHAYIHQTHKLINKEKCYMSHLHFDFIYYHVLSEVGYNSENILKIWYEVIDLIRCIIQPSIPCCCVSKKGFLVFPHPPHPIPHSANEHGLKIWKLIIVSYKSPLAELIENLNYVDELLKPVPIERRLKSRNTEYNNIISGTNYVMLL